MQAIQEKQAELATIVDILRWRAAMQPDAPVFLFREVLPTGNIREQALTFHQLHQTAQALAAALHEAGGRVGDHALLIYPPGREFIGAFFGCLYAGIIAVPLDYSWSGERLKLLRTLIEQVSPKLGLTSQAHEPIIKAVFEKRLQLAPSLPWLITDGEPLAQPRTPMPSVAVHPDMLACLQYLPEVAANRNVVRLSQRQLLQQVQATYQACGHSSQSRGVGWLPHFHEMGLFFTLLHPIYGGFPYLLMPPRDFLQHPLRWFQAISDWQATTAGAPAFGYELCLNALRAASPSPALNMSRLECLWIAADQCPPTLVEQVRTALQEYGLRREAVRLLTSALPEDQAPEPSTISESQVNMRGPSREELLQLEPTERKARLQASLCAQLAALLHKQDTAVRQAYSLISLGLGSLELVTFRQLIEDAYQVSLEIPALFEPGFDLERLTHHILLKLPEAKVTRLPKITPNRQALYDPFPLTDLQYAYWIGRHAHFDLGGVAAHIYFEIDVTDRVIDVVRLNQAWQTLIARHDMLHAIITTDGQQQILRDIPQYHIEVFDLAEEAHPEDMIEALRDRMSHQVFAPEAWPMFEICVARFAPTQWRIHFSLDMLICDVWSMYLLLKEWYALYMDDQAALAPLGMSYRDYVLALHAIKETPQYDRAKAYWQQRIATLPPAPQLPLIKSPKDVKPVRFTHRTQKFSPEVWQALKTTAARLGITPSGVLLAAFSKILSTWSKSAKFTLNLTVFNRLDLHATINSVIGDFTSVTLLEVDDSIPCNFIEFARKLQRQLAQDLEYRHYSGVEVIRDIEKHTEDLARAMMPVIFTSALAQQDTVVSDWQSLFIGTKGFSISQTPQLFLDCQVLEEGGTLVLNWDSVDPLFPPQMLDVMFARYVQLITQLATEALIWDAQIRSLLPEQQRQKRQAYNATAAPTTDDLLHTGFIRQAQTHPERPAILTLEKTIAYGELLQASSRVGHFLRDGNVAVNEPVAIIMHKGWEQIVAVLGILQAGGAYLSIDPELPLDRQKYLLAYNKVRFVLSQPWIDTQPIFSESIMNFPINETIFRNSGDVLPLPPIQSPDDLAYVLYTSGSTGLPKGVMISHRGALNTVHDINRKYQVTEQDRILALSALSFDLSVYDIFGMLTVGAALVMPKPHTTRDPDHWLALMEKHYITLWNSVPALIELLIENAEDRGKTLGLRVAMLSGDWIPITLPERLWKINEGVRLISLGGATEASIWSIYFPVDYVDTAWNSIPYGYPLDNQTFYVLNNQLGACPDWVTGELYIGGIGVALGYYGDHKRTHEAFITHPETGERLYRTGDLGRFLPEGPIEFLGREDFQVKIGGFRVELGEIESTLNQHPHVHRAAVKKLSGKDSNEFLAAYVVLTPPMRLGLQTPKPERQAQEDVMLDARGRLALQMKQPGVIRQIDAAEMIDLMTSTAPDRAAHYAKRATSRRFLDRVIPFDRFSYFLGGLRSLEQDGTVRYPYGSAGGIYPVQVYVHIKPDQITGIAGGIYYYHPHKHCLVTIEKGDASFANIHLAINRAVVESAAFSLFLVGDLEAVSRLYGARAREFCSLEAGLMTQLLEAAGMENQFGFCPIGAFANEGPLRQLLHLTEQQVILHTLVGGWVDYADPERGVAPSADFETTVSGEAILAKLREYCEVKLPRYMVPVAWILLDEMPLTMVGKVNYKALPEPKEEVRKKGPVSEPKSVLEQKIARVMEEKLGLKGLDIYTQFFDLGADSLTLMRVWRALKQELNLDFPVVRMFDNPTIHKLAGYLKTVQNLPQEENAIKQEVMKSHDVVDVRKRILAARRRQR